MRPLLAIALLVGLAPAAPVPKLLKKQPDYATRLVGVWRLTSRTMDGQESKIDDIVYVFRESQVQYRDMVGNSGTWTYSLDPTSSLPEMRWFSGPRHDWDVLFEIQGDSLRMAVTPKGHPRLTRVEPQAGVILFELVRDTSAK